ncbi:hypothetical protein [Romboutsia sp.]|uniref:hypothetical protein n=1 Tax=Romboutsia sp. TaxID=1965302 RepID=UPI003F3D981D
MIKHNSEILNKLFFRELQDLVEKYNKIDEDTKIKIEEIISNLRDEELKTYLTNNPNKLLEIIEETKEIELDKSVVTFFAWYNSEIKEIDLEKAKEYLEELKINNYLEVQDYIIYREEKYLKEYAKELLEDRLEQEYYVDKLFSKEQVIEMWIEGTTKEEMVQEIVDNDSLEEVLELYPQYAFTMNGIEYRYSQIEEE